MATRSTKREPRSVPSDASHRDQVTYIAESYFYRKTKADIDVGVIGYERQEHLLPSNDEGVELRISGSDDASYVASFLRQVIADIEKDGLPEAMLSLDTEQAKIMDKLREVMDAINRDMFAMPPKLRGPMAKFLESQLSGTNAPDRPKRKTVRTLNPPV